MAKALKESLAVEVQASPAEGKTGKIEVFWVTGGASTHYLTSGKVIWSGGKGETASSIPKIVELAKSSKP